DAGADLDRGLDTGALGPHLLDAAVDVMLLELEVGDPVAQQPAEAVIAFVDDDRVPGPGQLLGAGQTRRSRADDGHCVSGDPLRDLWGDQARGESLVDDADLDL